MTKIDRYILRNFFKTLILWYVTLLGLFIVFDLFANMDGVITAAQENTNVIFAIARYYFFKSFQYFDILVSLLIMISAMITLSTMIRHNELIPLLAAGVSQLRIVMPIIGAAVLVTFLAMACRELLLPQYLNDLLINNPSELGQNNGTLIEGLTDYQTGIQLNGEKGFWTDHSISHPSLVMPSGLNQFGRSIEAERAEYLPGKGNRPAGYLLKNVISPKELLEYESLKQEDETVIITPKDAPDWIAPTDCFVISNITFNQLAGGAAWRQFASTAELIEGLRNPSLRLSDTVQSTVHARVTQPLLDCTLLLLGLPIILSKSDRNVFRAMGISFLLILFFLALQLASKQMLQPVLGAWFPLIIFVPVAAYLCYDLTR